LPVPFVSAAAMVLVKLAVSDADEPGRANANVVVTTSVVTPLFGAYYLESNIRLARRWGLVVNTSRLTLADDDWTSTGNTVTPRSRSTWGGRFSAVAR